MWHWFKNPTSDARIYVDFYIYTEEPRVYIARIDSTGWGIPDKLFETGPPMDSIGLIDFCLKKTDDSVHSFPISFRCNSSVLESNNVSINVPFSESHITTTTYNEYMLTASVSITLDSKRKNFKVLMTGQIYYPTNKQFLPAVYGETGAKSVAVQGVNIYY